MLSMSQSEPVPVYRHYLVYKAPNYPPLEIGEIVKLNSGSPKLTVVDFNEKRTVVTVAWTSAYGVVREFSCHDECFRRV